MLIRVLAGICMCACVCACMYVPVDIHMCVSKHVCMPSSLISPSSHDFRARVTGRIFSYTTSFSFCLSGLTLFLTGLQSWYVSSRLGTGLRGFYKGTEALPLEAVWPGAWCLTPRGGEILAQARVTSSKCGAVACLGGPVSCGGAEPCMDHSPISSVGFYCLPCILRQRRSKPVDLPRHPRKCSASRLGALGQLLLSL